MQLKATIIGTFALIALGGAQNLKNSNFRQLLDSANKGGSQGGGGSAPPSSGNQPTTGGGAAPATPPATGGSPAPAGGATGGASPPAGGAATPTGGASAPTGGSSTPTGGASTPTGGSAPSEGGGGGGSGSGPTYDQFVAAVNAYSKTTAGGTPPKPSQALYDAYVKNVASKMPIKEQAMFLANSIWETGGLQHMKEIACSNGSCTYGKYYGRGFMQLTWDYNYKAASQGIYKDDRLVTNPDLAAEPDGAWATAVWFWTTNVRSAVSSAIDSYQLGHSVKKINGALECPANDKAKNRLAIYNEILKAWNIASNNPGTLTGC